MNIPEPVIHTSEDQFIQKINLGRAPEESLLRKAYKFAAASHQDQIRYSGEPYLNHAINTSLLLSEWRLDTASMVAGLLHDTVEDGEATVEKLTEEFGDTVAKLVDGVTKISNIRLRNSRDEVFVENLRKMIVAMSKDLRVVLVKLADRLDNMRTLDYVPIAKQKRIARETLEVYSPLADRLGMGLVKGELDDLAFPFVYPEDFNWLKSYSSPYYRRANEDTKVATRTLQKKLNQQGLSVSVNGRTKRLYSLYRKLLRKDINKDIGKIYDLVALRVVVDTIPQCYMVLGLVHHLWKPVPWLGISDFIAQPKPNGYRSIHTKVFMGNRIAEIQIRTDEMHIEAEYGIASHWYYANVKANENITSAELDKGTVFTPKDKMVWVKQLVDMLREVQDNKELIDNLKLDLFRERIFVYTPMGDVIDLPEEATPIDFAYSIHTDLGDMAKGAMVNGKLVSLDFRLKSGDVCSIIKSKENKRPSRDWLNFVVTNSARTRITRALRSQAR